MNFTGFFKLETDEFKELYIGDIEGVGYSVLANKDGFILKGLEEDGQWVRLFHSNPISWAALKILLTDSVGMDFTTQWPDGA